MEDEQKVEQQDNVESPQKVKRDIEPARMGRRQIDRTFEELKELQETVKKFKFGDFVVPILSIIALSLLSVFVYIPMISKAVENVREVREVGEKIKMLEKLNNDLDGIDQTVMQTDLANSRKVIPFSLQVSDFLSYVDTSARSKGLDFKDILAGDISIKSSTEKKGIDSVIKGVSGPLKYTGNLTQITNFLDQIQATSPYIISADQIKLKRTASAGTWEIALTVTGYYIDQAGLKAPDIYLPFTAYTQFKPVMEVFSTKALQSNN